MENFEFEYDDNLHIIFYFTDYKSFPSHFPKIRPQKAFWLEQTLVLF